MKKFELMLPRVETFMVGLSLANGSFLIGVICLAFSVFHIYLALTMEHANGTAKAMAYVMVVSHIVFALFNIMLIMAVIQQWCNKVKAWVYGAAQNGILLILTSLIASPFFHKRADGVLVDPAAAIKQWPLTIILTMVAFIEFYFVIVVTSYYIECFQQREKSIPKRRSIEEDLFNEKAK